MRLITRDEIDGHGLCPAYLVRWTMSLGPWKVYLHHFLGDDWTPDHHDHPHRFWSIGLWGRYDEETPAGTRQWRAPWVRTFPAEHRHRIRNANGAWTLCIVGRPERQWGFWLDGTRWLHWREYVDRFGLTRKDC
jgi:hypothetical protein